MSAKLRRFDIRQAGKPILLVLLLGFAANAAFYLLVVRPAAVEYREINDDNSPLYEELDVLEAIVDRRESYLEALGKADQDLQYIRDEILSTKKRRMIAVQAELDSLCRQFNIDVDTVDYDHDLLMREELDVLRMVVPLQGGYATLRQFLQAVESSSNFLLIERVALGQGRDGGVQLQLSITLTTYFDAPDHLLQPTQAPARPRRGRA